MLVHGSIAARRLVNRLKISALLPAANSSSKTTWSFSLKNDQGKKRMELA
jgi:hypothetical protein